MNNKDDIKFLFVDDCKENIQILATSLKVSGFKNITIHYNSLEVLNFLKNNPNTDIILLDRMLPEIDSIEIFKQIREDENLHHIDVIFQTGKVFIDEINECIKVGALHLLKKPFRLKELNIFLNPIVEKRFRRRFFEEYISNQENILKSKSIYNINSLEQIKETSAIISLSLPYPLKYCEAIYQLILNAFEHGNLGIGYFKKKHLINTQDYHNYLKNISLSKDGFHNDIIVETNKNSESIILKIIDSGHGFNPNSYNKLNASIISEPSGKGIIYAQSIFDQVNYNTTGNEVTCIINL